MQAEDIIRDYINEYNKTSSSDFSKEELTNILAFHKTLLHYQDDILEKNISFRFDPYNMPNTFYVFKNPENVWETYYIDGNNVVRGRNFHEDSYNALLEILNYTIIGSNNIKKIFNYFDKHTKKKYSDKLLESYNDEILYYIKVFEEKNLLDERNEFMKNKIRYLK